jgi:NAD(P)-dependent dehydrogenase (short-subunit alcohol dehydrogenase family)
MNKPAGVSADGFEIHFATNHLGHAMLIQQLLPVMLKTAELPDSDVRLVSLTSTGWMLHPKGGVTFTTVRGPQNGFFESELVYG